MLPDRNQHFDFIVAGAGAAGLSVVWHLINSPDFGNRQILLVDRDFSNANTRTWCFWDDRFLPAPELVHKSWGSIHVATDAVDTRSEITGGRYMCIRSGDWSQKLMMHLAVHPGVTVLKDEVLDVRENGDHAVIVTTTGTWRATYALQSVKKRPKTSLKPPLYALKQHFLGLEIRSKRPVFDPNCMTLMDFRVGQHQATAFMYLLPFSETHAMVEYTLFSAKLLDDVSYTSEITHYMQAHYGLNPADYDIIGSERGSIPMEITGLAKPQPGRVIPIGAVSGITKPSTGYAFTRILRHSAGLANWLLSPNGPPPEVTSPGRFRFYDLLLMSILTREAHQSRSIFGALFQNNPADSLFEFLDERSSLGDEYRIFRHLPWNPFLKALAQNASHVLSGKF
jgi:lycopene beta-cyclase